MQACAKRGGFSLPNFKWYYWVMNVKQLRAWLPTAAVKPIWSQIETEVNGGISPWKVLFDTSHKLTHPIIANAKILWCKLQKLGCWDFIKSPLATLWGNKIILIGGTPVDWLQWRKAGILYQILVDCGTKRFLTFDQVVEIICSLINCGDMFKYTAHYRSGWEPPCVVLWAVLWKYCSRDHPWLKVSLLSFIIYCRVG